MSARGKPKDRRVKQAGQRALEKALREERLAIAAIVKVMLLEVPDPARVMARLDAMTRAAEADQSTSPTVRRQLIDATLFVRTAIERETGRPQSLFDPHVGHVQAREVDALVEPTSGPQQLGLVNHGTILGDVAAAHEDRVQTISKVHEAIVKVLRDHGAATDRELHGRYIMLNTDGQLPPQSLGAIGERRRELLAAGRLVSAGKNGKTPLWDVIERELIGAAPTQPGGTAA